MELEFKEIIKYFNLIDKLIILSKKSVLSIKHSAAVIKNGKIMSYGFNTVNGKYSHHAECNAIINYLKEYNIIISNSEILDREKGQCFLCN
jgi:hypothetical protein